MPTVIVHTAAAVYNTITPRSDLEMHPDQGQTPAFALPVELYHHIIDFLDIRSIIALRKTCRHFYVLTQDRSLWSSIFARFRTNQALACSRTEFTSMPPPQAERVLFWASKLEPSFMRLREPIHYIPAVRLPYTLVNASTYSWRVLSFISDRFLLSMDNNAVIVWDTSKLTSSPPSVVSSPWAQFTLTNLIGYADHHSVLCVAVSRVQGDHHNALIYTIPLPPLEASDSDHGRLHSEAEFPLLGGELLKHMDPFTGRALFYCPPTSIHILHWRDDNKRLTIPIQVDDAEEAWDGITALRFCGPYILCFRVRSVEAYPVPTDCPANPLPMLRHRLGPVCFRAVSLSHVRPSHCVSGEAYTIYMLSSDVYQGMFHYQIRVTTAPPSLSVRVLAKGGIPIPDPPPLMPGTNIRYTMMDMARRMFVGAWSVGSAGLRGVWVDRQRGSIDRRVVAFTTHPRRLRAGHGRTVYSDGCESDNGDEVGGDGVDGWDDESVPVTPMEGKVVHVISSYDLRDDITICAVSEWTGCIALGSRAGAISIL